MRLVLLGAPGSGKGTQATRLRDHFGVPHISTGELLRAAVKAGTPLGLQAKAVMESGALVSDEIVLAILDERLSQGDTGGGYILDGYPRNLAQANALDGLLTRLAQPVERAIQLDVDNELLIARLAGRAKAEGRADDNPESVRKRLEVYDEQTAPVIDYYRHQQKLTAVDGVGSMEDVFARIVEALESRYA
ncbi:MAG TPA: adenylate kinase [Xanthomonadaceae bacterium]|jgi:adenylate kinase|nr:adenylate kinase [Xanthomonadaceae bacterium]